jgi:hypothetical protein
MRHNQRGIPTVPQTVLVDSTWRPGPTVRRHGKSWVPAFLAAEPMPPILRDAAAAAS